MREVEAGSLFEAERPVEVYFGASVRAVLLWLVVAERIPGTRMVLVVAVFGLGVMLRSAEGRRDLFWADGAGVFSMELGLGKGAEASDIGGDGGSLRVGAPLFEGGNDMSSGGVVTRGELAIEERGESSNVGDSGMEISVEMADRWRISAFLILSCMISASTFRSDSSSRNL